ncbi:MAG: FlgD immunoglobulin-like domain containing protein [bacterium]|nr:FlgD immunoglobulin-like domain containing protein [bacterium]
MNKNYTWLLGLLTFYMAVPLYAQQKPITSPMVETPFNVGQIIEKISHHPMREGERIVIKDQSYEAFFDERGVTIKAQDAKGNAQDMVIPLNTFLGGCGPEIRDGRVVYQGWDGAIAFEGTRRGLRFVENLSMGGRNPDVLFADTWAERYTGNVVGLTLNPSKSLLEGPEVGKSGEFLLDTNIVYVSAAYNQWSPSIAFDGTNYLVVWKDYRGGSYDIYGARVSTAGAVLDSSGIAIAIATVINYQFSPTVAFDGTNYLVVWGDGRNGSYDIYGTRVSQAGAVLDATGIAISTAADDQLSPTIAFDGTNYLVAWLDYRNGFYSDIYGARVSTAGALLDAFGKAISTVADNQVEPSVAFNGTNYLVVWEDYRNGSYPDIYGVLVSKTGVALDTVGIAICKGNLYQYSPFVAPDGTNYLVVWEDFRNGSYDIYGARVNQAGAVLDSSSIAICTVANHQYSPSIVFDGTNCMVVWEDLRNGSYDIYGARVNQAGTVLDTFGKAISTAAYYQFAPSVAFDGTNYLVVWEDYRNGAYDIYGARVNQAGAVLDASGIAISTAVNSQGSPSVAFNGTNYLVAWLDYRNGFYSDIYGARVSTAGAVLDTFGIAISTAANNQSSPSVSSDGTNYLVVWQDGSFSFKIRGARVSQGGAVLDSSAIVVYPAANNQFSPSIAFDGTNYLVVWQDGSYAPNIYGARVNQAGTVLDASGIAISTAVNSQGLPSVAFDSTNYLVVWHDSRNGSSDIYGARVTQDGAVLDSSGIAISAAANSQSSPSVAFSGTNYLVVWEDNRNGSYDIYGTRVYTSGILGDSFAITTQSGNQSHPALASGPCDQMLIAYQGWVDYINGHPAKTDRIFRILVSASPLAIEELNFTSTRVNNGVNLEWATLSWYNSYKWVIKRSSDDRNYQVITTVPGSASPNGQKYRYTDRVETAGIYYYQLFDDKNTLKGELMVTVNLVPLSYELSQNYPNPLHRGSTTISYALKNPGKMSLVVYNIAGQVVKTLGNENQQPGYYSITWDGRDESGQKVSSGIYPYRIQAGGYNDTKKLVVLK